jgi:hypothetical protein
MVCAGVASPVVGLQAAGKKGAEELHKLRKWLLKSNRGVF